jgi:catecholate siderophore receptor
MIINIIRRGYMSNFTLLRALAGASTVGLTSAAAFGQTVAANDAESVVVTDRKLNVDLLPEKILDTPQSIDVVPAQVIKEQGVTSLQDALKNVPGITLNAGEGGTHGDLVNLRGFPINDDYFLDGLRDTGLYNRDVFNVDSIEVYKGPASTLFGRGTTGGVINQVSKSPELYPIYDFAATGGTNAEIRLTGDVNYVLGDDMAVRLNLMAQRNNVEGRPFARTQKWGAAPSFAWGLGSDTVATLQYLHQQEDDIPDYGIPFLVGQPAPVSHRNYYGLPSDDRTKQDVEIVTGKVTHKFDDVFSISDTARFGSYWFDSQQTAAIYGSANCFANSASFGFYSGGTLCSSLPAGTAAVPASTSNPLFPTQGVPLANIFVQRDRPSSNGIITTWMNSTDLSANFTTWSFVHHLTFGFQADVEDASLNRFANQNTVIVPTPLLNPNPYEAFPGRQTTVSSQPITKTSTLSTYVVDEVQLDPQWSITGGLRYDNFGARFDQSVGTASHFTHKDSLGSPRAALVYKPTENSSLYFSYGTSYNPSAETLSLSASNQGLGPERDKTYEFGGKTTLLDGQLALTAAAFNTVKTNARISDPLNPGLQSLAGTERVNGVEFGAHGHLTENWEITAGYTYLAPHAVGLIAANVPGPMPDVAHDQANLWTVYDWDFGLHTGVGVNWVGRRSAATGDTLSVPGTTIYPSVPAYVTVDAMVSYPITDAVSVQLNGYNLGNEFYYADIYDTKPGENHSIPGAGRTFLLSVGASL